MTPKEIATHYGAKIFDSPDAATAAGFVLTERHAPRNVWNKASAAQSCYSDCVTRKKMVRSKRSDLLTSPFSVTGCYLPKDE
jgi:hypothetical protein